MTSPLRAIPAPGLVIGGILSVQVGAGVAKELFEILPPSAVVFLRLTVSALVFVAMAWQQVRRHATRASRTDLLVAVAFGLTLAGMNLSFYEAVARIPLGVAVTIEFVGPLSVSVIFSRRPLDLLWVALAGGGVLLLAGGLGSDLDPAGVAFAAIAGLGWALYILLSAQTGQRFPGSSGLAVASVVAAFVMAPIGITSGGSDLWQPEALAIGAAIGVLSSVIPYRLELEALRRMPAGVFGILMSLEPAVAALVGLVLLDEVLGLGEWVAIGCVVAASVGATIWRRRPDGRDA